MSRAPTLNGERGQRAAEYALGLLTGAELSEARALFAADEAFRGEVGAWAGRLAPLLDEVAPMTPPESVWQAIERSLGPGTGGSGNVVALRRRVSLWRGIATGASALAAGLAMILVLRPGQVAPPVEQPVPAPAPLVAMLGGEDPDARLLATWNPDQQRLVVAAADSIDIAADRTRELWVIPADGTPRSLGTISGAPRTVVALTGPVAGQLRRGATLAVSIEPQGGSPTGLPTGPVVVTGTLEPV